MTTAGQFLACLLQQKRDIFDRKLSYLQLFFNQKLGHLKLFMANKPGTLRQQAQHYHKIE